MTGAKVPGPRGEREISRKTIAQGRPDDPAPPVVLPRATFYACGPRVRAGTRSSLRPLYLEGHVLAQLGRITPRDGGRVFSPLFEN